MGHRLEQLAGEVQRGADARVPIGELAGLGARESRELERRSGRHVVVDDEHVGVAVDLRHRDEVLERIVGQVLVELAVDHDVAGRHDADGVAVGGRLDDVVHGDVTAAAGHVLDDDRLAQDIAELVGHQPGRGIDAGGKSEQQPDVAIRIVLRGRGNGSSQEEGRGEGKADRSHHQTPSSGGPPLRRPACNLSTTGLDIGGRNRKTTDAPGCRRKPGSRRCLRSIRQPPACRGRLRLLS